jgi:adenosylcobinamide kinase / adenosylcobinamide-phosphate guanylyltransferase
VKSLPRLSLVLGGARSGKSRYAEGLIAATGGGVYLATAQAMDDEMRARISEHRARRASAWTTMEEPIDLAGALARADAARPVLIDCLTLWLSNLMLAGRDCDADSEALVAALNARAAPVVAVSNEVGLGIVPDNALARAFRDAQGTLNQRIAMLADRVVLMTAGLPLVLKEERKD